jgi:hypothetical protein
MDNEAESEAGITTEIEALYGYTLSYKVGQLKNNGTS